MRIVLYIVSIYVLTTNLLAFLLFGIDKYKSLKSSWRIRESTLLLTAFFGGSIGAMFGMLMFHHKTGHLKFRILVPLCFLMHIALVVLTYWYLFISVR